LGSSPTARVLFQSSFNAQTIHHLGSQPSNNEKDEFL
jgi:hypothetical protein